MYLFRQSSSMIGLIDFHLLERFKVTLIKINFYTAAIVELRKRILRIGNLAISSSNLII